MSRRGIDGPGNEEQIPCAVPDSSNGQSFAQRCDREVGGLSSLMIRVLQTRNGAIRLERPGNEEQIPVSVLYRSEAAAPHHRQGDLSHLTGLSAAVRASRECAI